jgi:hypothetical protein
MLTMKPLWSLVRLGLSAALVCSPAYAAGGGGHGGGHGAHSSHSGYGKISGKSGRSNHYGGAKRSAYHINSGFKSTHLSRYARSRSMRPIATSEHLVSGYYRRDGNFVQPYLATNPDSTRNNNYSTRGNANPHTGVAGTKPRDGE